jgi:hypothetical protein
MMRQRVLPNGHKPCRRIEFMRPRPHLAAVRAAAGPGVARAALFD